MVAQPTSSIHAERYEKRMPVGSYQLRLESPQHDPVVYPFQLNFGVDWDSREPGAIDVNKPLTLPPQGEVGVEIGTFLRGGSTLGVTLMLQTAWTKNGSKRMASSSVRHRLPMDSI